MRGSQGIEMRRGELILNIGPPVIAVTALVVFIIVSSATKAPSTYSFVSTGLIVLGFLLFLKAKLSIIRKGRLISRGFRHMSAINRLLYCCGYLLMMLGVLFLFGAWIGLQR